MGSECTSHPLLLAVYRLTGAPNTGGSAIVYTNSTQFVNSTVHNIEIRLYTIYELNGTQYRNSTVHNLRIILYTLLYFTVHNSCFLEYTICVSALKTHKFWRGGPREFMRYTKPVFIPRFNRYRLGTI